MKIFSFENAELYFRNFHIGSLTDEIEFRGSFNQAFSEDFPDSVCSMMHSPDLILRFSLKEKSHDFVRLLSKNSSPQKTKLLSDFGALKIINSSGRTLYINDVFWIRYPMTEFQIRRDSDNMIHSVYFLHEKYD